MGHHDPMTRRCALGMLALGTSAPVLTACGSGDGGGTATTSPSDPSSSAPSPSSSPRGSGTPSATASATGEPLVAASEVPVGGGVIVAGAEVVITQPTEGQFQGFSAICPHAQFVLSEVTQDDIFCGDGHGSRFALDDGSVINGPATSPLPEVPVTVQGGQVVRA